MVQTYLLNEVRGELFSDLKDLALSQNVCDVKFKTKDGEVFSQKLFLLSSFPILKEWICDFCIFSHDELLFVLPEFSNMELQKALEGIYSTNETYQLQNIFGLSKSIDENKEIIVVNEDERDKIVLDNYEATEMIEATKMYRIGQKIDREEIADITEFLSVKVKSEDLEHILEESVNEKNKNKTRHGYEKGLTKRWLKNGKKCEDCGILIKFRQNIRRHLTLNCPALGKVVTKETIKSRQSTPSTCDDCGKSFGLRNSLMKHRRDRHMSDMDKLIEFFHCKLCNFKVASETYLKVHISKVHGVKQESCEVCGAKYANRDTLRKHKKANHLFLFY